MAIFFERFDFVVLKPVKVSENAWPNSEAENILDADKKSDIKWVSDVKKTARGIHFNHDGFGCEKTRLVHQEICGVLVTWLSNFRSHALTGAASFRRT